MSLQNIFILGATGNVWSELVKQIQTHDGVNHEHRNPTNIIGIANSSRYALSSGWVIIPDSSISQENVKLFLNENEYSRSYQNYEQILEAVRKSWMEGEVIFIDVTANGTEMIQFHKTIIQETANRIVTANKKPAAADMQTFEIITGNPHRYKYNTTVMAWWGAVPYFQESHGLSESIESVEGTFSGTLAYVCSELEKWEKLFSQIVAEAKDRGYTEPHPIDDLNGEDVKRKLLILLRSAGIRIEEDKIELNWLVDPKQYENMDIPNFMESIKQEDERIKKSVKDALSEWKVPRYIASYRNESGSMVARVWLQFISQDSELGNLKGTANKVLVFTSQRTPLESNTPHVIQSPGAWTPKTAASVRADLLYLLNGTNLWQHN